MDNRKDECESPVNTEPASTDGDQNDFTADQTSSESLKLPRHQYTRDQLLAWRDVRCSRLKPSSMSREYESCEGIWDPEKWFNSTIGDCSLSSTSGYNSHFTAGEKMYSRGRKPDWDADDGTRRTANKMINDKGPGFKQNVGDADVVLMPQRNFNSGCYVSNNDSQHRRDGDQRFSQRVVGSGRIPVVDRFKGRTSEDVSDGWNERIAVNSGRPRGKGIDKRYESGSRSDYKSNTRDTKKTSEPLWYREGPLSRSDTIELRGFNERSDEYHPGERNRKLSLKLKEEKIDEEGEGHDVEKKVKQAEIDKGTNVAESNTKELNVLGENVKESRNDCEGSSNEFDFAMFAKAVSNPNNQDSELDSRESRFRQFFQTQVSQDSLTNGVNLDKKASLPPPPPVYGHSIEKFVDPSEEKKNFMQILQKAQISYQNHQVHPNSARTPSVDGISSFNQKPASLKEFESDLKAMLKVNPDSSDGKTLNSASGVFYGPIYNGNKTEGSILPSSGSNRNLFLGHKPLPVGSKVTRVSDLEAGSVTLESFMSSEGGHPEKSSDPDDMSAYNKLLGLVSQKGPQNHSLANHNYHESYPVSGSPNYPNKMSDSSYHQAMTSSVNSLLASMSNDKRHTHSPSVRSSPIAFGTCPPTNLATPMPIHAGHLINQFVSNGNQCAKVQFNKLDPSLKFGAQNSIDHPPKEPVITSQSLERMHPAFLPTSVIRQMAQDKAEKKRCLKLDPQSFCPDVFSSGSKVVPQDAVWTMFRSNTGEGGSAVFQPPLYNAQAPHNFSPHNQLQPPCMSVFARPPQQPSVASFLQCLQQGRVITQPQQQQMLHPLLQHQVNNALPAKRAIVKGANNSSIQPDQQNVSIVALQHGQVLGNAQVDQSSPADVIAALQQALISKRHNPNSGFEGWHNGASSVNGSSVGRTPNQVKLQ